ncbi:MAG: helix-turn-helix domain-containing protein [Candidatus Izemoplasmataceae bacterium]
MSKRFYLKALRKTKAYTMDEISEAAGISYNHYQLIESGKRGLRLSLIMAYKLASSLNITLEEFYRHEYDYLKQLGKVGESCYD